MQTDLAENAVTWFALPRALLGKGPHAAKNEGKTCILWIYFPIGIQRCTSWLGGGWFSTIFFPMIRHIFTMFIHTYVEKPRHFLTPISLPETLLGNGVLQSKPDLAITTLNPDMMS